MLDRLAVMKRTNVSTDKDFYSYFGDVLRLVFSTHVLLLLCTMKRPLYLGEQWSLCHWMGLSKPLGWTGSPVS